MREFLIFEIKFIIRYRSVSLDEKDGDLSLSDDNFTYFRKWKKKKWSWASYLDLNLHLRARYVKF